MNNDNNSESVENNITECDATLPLMILKKEQKKINQGEQWLIKISKKFLSWETVL